MSKISKLFKGSSSSSSSSSSSRSRHHRSRGAPTTQEALHKLRETEEMLTKKQDFLEKKIEQELMIAKKNGTKNKRGELRAKLLSHLTLLRPVCCQLVKVVLKHRWDCVKFRLKGTRYTGKPFCASFLCLPRGFVLLQYITDLLSV